MRGKGGGESGEEGWGVDCNPGRCGVKEGLGRVEAEAKEVMGRGECGVTGGGSR